MLEGQDDSAEERELRLEELEAKVGDESVGLPVLCGPEQGSCMGCGLGFLLSWRRRRGRWGRWSHEPNSFTE